MSQRDDHNYDFDLTGDDDGFIDRLHKSAAAPDQTGRIMCRLGYRFVTGRNAKRLRTRRAMRRYLVLAGLALVIGLNYHWYAGSDQVRAPQEQTLPTVVAEQMQKNQKTMTGFFEAMRKPTMMVKDESVSVSTEHSAGGNVGSADQSPQHHETANIARPSRSGSPRPGHQRPGAERAPQLTPQADGAPPARLASAGFLWV